MNGVRFNKQSGGLARALAGETHISGLILYGEATTEIKVINSVQELEGNGIFKTSVLHYHVSEFFRINPGATLYYQSVSTSDGNYTEISNMQNFANGNIRQFAICDFKSEVSNLSNSVGKIEQKARYFWKINTPANFLLSMKITGADMITLPDLHSLKAENVSVVIGQDGAGRGKYLADMGNVSFSCVGATLGAVSKAQIHESIAWVERQNLVTDFPYDKELTGGKVVARELDTPAFCDGSLLSEYTQDQLEDLDAKGYLFAIKHTGITGSYFNDSYTAISLDSDFAFIENGRTISEAVREVNKVLIPKVSSPFYVDPTTGELDANSVSALEALCDEVLERMIRNGQISGFAVTIDPNQKILSTSKLQITIKIVPVGTLREIVVNLGLSIKNN